MDDDFLNTRLHGVREEMPFFFFAYFFQGIFSFAVLEMDTVDSSPVFLGSGENSFVHECPALCALRKQL